MSEEMERWRQEVVETEEKAKAQVLNVSLITTRTGAPKQGIENSIRALEQDELLAGRFRYNELTNAIDASLPLPWSDGRGERRVTEADEIELAAYLEGAHDLRSKRNAADALVAVAHRNAKNPIADRFAALPEWDGQRRAGHLLHWFLGADEEEYTQAVERLIFSGAIMRTYSPGAKFDYMPVLVGGQGIGKSTFARKLALSDEWFTDGIVGIGTKEAAELAQGKLIIEVAELDALKGNRLETTKAFITRTSDDFRAAYGRHAERHPRRFVLVGTTNADRFLTDATGNRRFLPVRCGKSAPALDLFGDEAVTAIEQAWAEMLHAYRLNGTLPLVLPRELRREASRMQEDAAMDDPRIGEIGAWLDGRKPGELICAKEVAENALNLASPKRYEIDDVHSLMRAHFPEWVLLPSKKRVGAYGIQRAYRKGTAEC